MQLRHVNSRLLAFPFAASILLAACGGGDSAVGYSTSSTALPQSRASSQPSVGARLPTAAALGKVVAATPSNYLSLLATLKPGDTLLLSPGNYGITAGGDDTSEPPGLPIVNLHGTAVRPITIKGPDKGPRPVMFGRATHNTIRFVNSSHVIVKGIEVNGRNLRGSGVGASGAVHHIVLESLVIHGVGGNQQNVGISSTGAYAWNWVIRGNVIDGAGTGMYLGSSSGGSPFVGGLIENNLIKNSIGYNFQIKHQARWARPPPAMPTGPIVTIVRNNVFSKLSRSVSPDGARPNVLVGDQPPGGPGSQNGFEIYGNFFWQNPTEALFQGEGNVAFYSNLLVNQFGDAIKIQRHNGQVRHVLIFGNTVVATGTGISVSGGQAGSEQRVLGNAIFAGSAIAVTGADAIQADNVIDSYEAAGNYLNNPTGPIGLLDLSPKAGQLVGSPLNVSGLAGVNDHDRDFNNAARTWTLRGAYAGEGTNPGWRPALEIKPWPEASVLSADRKASADPPQRR